MFYCHSMRMPCEVTCILATIDRKTGDEIEKAPKDIKPGDSARIILTPLHLTSKYIHVEKARRRSLWEQKHKEKKKEKEREKEKERGTRREREKKITTTPSPYPNTRHEEKPIGYCVEEWNSRPAMARFTIRNSRKWIMIGTVLKVNPSSRNAYGEKDK